MEVRDATVADADLLWRMLTYAASMDPGGEESVAVAKGDPDLSFYVDGFGTRPGDLGVIAASDGGECGAVWLRLGQAAANPTKVATATEPELAIGVEPAMRGHGIGGLLLAKLVERARGRYPAILLSVRTENPSVHLYERVGFRVVSEITNRVGSRSLSMRLALG